MLLLARRFGLESWSGNRGGRLFKQSAEQLSHVTERERLAQEAVRESQDRGRDMDHASVEPEKTMLHL